MNDDEFEWDDVKAETNLRKHKISFQEARRVFDDLFALVEQDLGEAFGEDRFVATGMVEGLIIVVVYTERGERIRLISARKANSNEQRRYYRSQTPS
jgi:uncharacterized DUF497 family protein